MLLTSLKKKIHMNSMGRLFVCTGRFEHQELLLFFKVIVLFRHSNVRTMNISLAVSPLVAIPV